MVQDNASFGAGSGGGPATANHAELKDGTFTVAANQVELICKPPMPPAIPGPSIVTVLAAGTGVDGLVDVRGSQGVRLTAGPPPGLPVYSPSTNGVEILVSETGTLTMQRGLLPTDQKMEMTPAGVTIDAGMGKVTIKSLTQIELSACNGLAKITLGPQGVTIEGLQIRLPAQIMTQVQGMMTQVSGEAITQISGGITMIG